MSLRASVTGVLMCAKFTKHSVGVPSTAFLVPVYAIIDCTAPLDILPVQTVHPLLQQRMFLSCALR